MLCVLAGWFFKESADSKLSVMSSMLPVCGLLSCDLYDISSLAGKGMFCLVLHSEVLCANFLKVRKKR